MAKALNIEGLDCGANVLEGTRLVLRARLEEMCALRDHALDWNDMEGVHDMRVASRRLRSALRDFQPFGLKTVPRKRLKAIADALGAVRDEDVAIDALAKLREEAEEEKTAGIEQIMDEHRLRRERARANLEAAISPEALSRFKEKFIAGLEETTQVSNEKGKRRKRSEDIEPSFSQAGREIILSRFGELSQLSKSLYRPFDTKPLHRMRIAAKRLRYAIELFTPCWTDEIEPFAQAVAELQKSLGELHDCDVWINDLGARLSKLHQKRIDGHAVIADSHAPQRSVATWLLRHFVKERTTHYRDALARWHEWEGTDFSTRLATSLEADHYPAGHFN